MTVADVFLAVLAAAVVWKLYQLCKAPNDGPLRSVTACLICAAASYPLAMPGGSHGFDTLAGSGTARLVQNLLLLAAMYFLMCFYLYSAADEAVGRRRARWEGLVLILVLGVATVAGVSAGRALSAPYVSVDMAEPWIMVFYQVAGLYMMYVLAAAGVWTCRCARKSRRPLATGLWMAAPALFGMALACAIRAVIVAVRWRHGSLPALVPDMAVVLLVFSVFFFVIGFSYPGVRSRLAATRIWLQHRRRHRRLEPLWQLLTDAYPQTVLKEPDVASWRERRRSRSIHRRYHRRVMECRDGLVRISPHLHAHAADRALTGDASPEALAVQLQESARAIGQEASGPRRPIALAVPAVDDPEADVRQLLALSDALRAVS